MSERRWVLNGARTRAFPAHVLGQDNEVTVVFNETKNEMQAFDTATGEAVSPDDKPWRGPVPVLVAEGDPTALRLAQEARVAALSEDISRRMREFNDNITPENLELLKQAVEAFGTAALRLAQD